LLQWFETNNDDPTLEIPGFFELQNMIQKSNVIATGTNLSLGVSALHYKYGTREMDDPGLREQDFFQDRTTLIFTNAIITANLPVRVTPTNMGYSPGIGIIRWGTIIGVDDSGPGTSAWRQWQKGQGSAGGPSGPATTTQMGIDDSVIYWRSFYVAGVEYACFFPTMADAQGATSYESGGNFFLAGATVAAGGVKYFSLQNINGVFASGSVG